MEKKLIFLHYIISQSDDSLAHQILYEQWNNNWPGLVQECNQFIEQLNILDPFKVNLSKNEWKKMVKEAISKANSDELKDEITNKYKKLKKSELEGEDF
jgi:ABC-type amino acid transport substrate-binding protein